MRLAQVRELLDGTMLCGDEQADGLEVQAAFAADLMSDVLAFAGAEALLITGLTSIQAVHTADVADLRAVLFVSGKRPGQAVLDLARQVGLPLLTTPRSLFEACAILHAAGLPGSLAIRADCRLRDGARLRPNSMNSDEVLFSETFTIHGNDFDHGGEAATRVKAILKQLGVPTAVIRRLSIANFEAEMNVIMYAEEAVLRLEVLADAVRVEIADRGQGIPDIDLAMQEGYSTATPAMRERGFGAGLGLPNIKKNSDLFEISSTVGKGTTLRYSVRLT